MHATQKDKGLFLRLIHGAITCALATFVFMLFYATPSFPKAYAASGHERETSPYALLDAAEQTAIKSPQAIACKLDARGAITITSQPLCNEDLFPVQVTRVVFAADPLRVTGLWRCSIDGTPVFAGSAGTTNDSTAGPIIAGGKTVPVVWNTTFPSPEAVFALSSTGDIAEIGTVTYTLTQLSLAGTLSLSGSPEPGSRLQATLTGAQSDAAPTLQWYTGSTAHATTTLVATGDTYTISPSDRGLYITCVASDTKRWYTGSLSAGTDTPITNPCFSTEISFPTWSKGADGAYGSGHETNTGHESEPFVVPAEGALFSFDWAASTDAISLEYVYCELRDANKKVLPKTGARALRVGGMDGTNRAKVSYLPENIALPPGTYTAFFGFRRGHPFFHARLEEGFVKNVVLTTNDNCLATYSWDELSIISRSIAETGIIPAEIQRAFKRGYRKIVKLADGSSLDFMIAGFNHDTKSDGTGKAGITFTAAHRFTQTYPINATNTNTGGWKSSLIRTETLAEGGVLWNLLPTDLTANIVTVDKQTNNVGRAANAESVTTTADKLWMMSSVELVGDTGAQWWSGTVKDAYLSEGFQYEAFKNLGIICVDHTWLGGSAISRTLRPYENYDDSTTDCEIWSRSPHPNSDTQFSSVLYNGSFDNATESAIALGVVPSFAL